MKFLKNTIGFLSVFCMVPAVFGVTVRPGAISAGNAVMGVSASGTSRRMPTVRMATTNSGLDYTINSSVLLDKVECVDAYMECIESEDACGEGFSECTTNLLFHAQMADCASTLLQCSGEGVVTLFGADATTGNLSSGAKVNDDGEVTGYFYPTADSLLGQKIEGGRIENMYDKQTCIKRYTNCLKRDDVCGENFELCSSTRSFRKQALNCDSHLARCEMVAVREMFGDGADKKSIRKYGVGTTDGKPVEITDLTTIGGSIATMISDGADYVAANAVSSCYKTVDACIVNACKKNPLRCVEGTNVAAVQAAQGVSDGTLGSDLAVSGDILTASEINRYLRTTCADTVGTLDACHITYFGKKPKASDLTNPEIMDEVFVMAHNDRKSILESKIQGILQDFDTDAKDQCRETLMQCAMRSCGGGSGAACYKLAKDNTAIFINGKNTYKEIKTSCKAIVDTDPYCIYAYNTIKNADYSYAYSLDNGLDDGFATLFPEHKSHSVEADPLGLVAALNSALSLNYNDAAIANMEKECKKVATSCVRSLCGSDYVNCYRNRTDIYSSLTSSGEDSFNKSMNKVGGVLDYTIVLGLCSETVKNAASCEEHLAIEKIKIQDTGDTSVWGEGIASVGEGWYDAGSASKITKEDGVQYKEGDVAQCYNEMGEKGSCDTMDGNGSWYTEPIMISYDTYVQNAATETLFRTLLVDLEREAQAKYNAKLTKQQNDCMAANNGGIMGRNDLAGTYMWAKLTGKKVPTDYSSQGLKSNQFVASNELYGSFCRLKVTIHSDDINIMNALNDSLVTKNDNGSVTLNADGTPGDPFAKVTLANTDWATRYFAVGDTFVCGSWIPQKVLLQIANAVGQNARVDAEAVQPKIKGWMAALGAIGLGTGGAFLGNKIQQDGGFAGLNNKTSKNAKNDKSCADLADLYSGNNYQSYANTIFERLKDADSDARKDISEAKKWVNLAAKSSFGDADIKKIEEANGITETAKFEKVTSNTDDNGCEAIEYAKWANKKCVKDETALKDAAHDIAADKVAGLVDLCETQEEQDANNWWKNNGGATIGGIVSAVGGAALGYHITDAIQTAQLDQEQQKAIEEFMNNIGSKIQCYVGAKPVGSYGQAVETSME